MIQIQNAKIGYKSRVVLDNVNLHIELGDFVGVVGPNGSGKTTLLKTILRLIPTLSGQVVSRKSINFAYVPQAEDLNLLWPLTVRELVSLGHRSKRVFGHISDQERIAIDTALSKTGLTSIADKLYSELSGGQRQKAILAQALSQKPDLLLLDEPTRGLDVQAEQNFLSLLTELNEQSQITIILVTHTLAIPLNTCGKIILVHENSIISTTPGELSQTDKLESIYGIPFLHGESNGVRWVVAGGAK